MAKFDNSWRKVPFEVPPEDPFLNDRLERQPHVETLSRFVQMTPGEFVLAIDAPWGEGKSAFVKMMRQHLENTGVPTFYFNAWENDFSYSPFLDLVGEFGRSISSLKLGEEQKSKARKAFEKTRELAAKAFKTILPIAVRVGSQGIVNLPSDVEGGIGDAAESVARDALENYEDERKTVAHFRTSLAAFSDEIVELSGGKPFVAFIDEIDRCRPSYAIELLERAKHLFDVPGIVFVLSVDKTQLAHGISAVYGAKFGTVGYLRRFFDQTYRLPPPPLGSYINHLFEITGLRKRLSDRDGGFALQNYCSVLAHCWEPTLREQEQCILRLEVTLKTIRPDYQLQAAALAIAVLYKELKPDEYEPDERAPLRCGSDLGLISPGKNPGRGAAAESIHSTGCLSYPCNRRS